MKKGGSKNSNNMAPKSRNTKKAAVRPPAILDTGELDNNIKAMKPIESVDGLVTIEGDSNTVTVPTNQNTGRANGNFCGNSFTFMVADGPQQAALNAQLTEISGKLDKLLAGLVQTSADSTAIVTTTAAAAPTQAATQTRKTKKKIQQRKVRA